MAQVDPAHAPTSTATTQRIPPQLRSIGIVAALIVIFGGLGSLLLGALDVTQQAQREGLQVLQQTNLFNPAQLFPHVAHFIGETIGVLTIYTDKFGTPFRVYFLQGVGLTIAFCFISMPLALLMGLTLALMSRSPYRWLRIPARAFVEFFRNTPLLVQMVAIYSGLIFLPNWLLFAYTAGIATLVLNYAAYECENIRAGIEALDRGQTEAAQVLGLSYWQTLRQIVIPQAIPVLLPPVINDLIYMYKDSSILSLITITELTAQTNELTRFYPARTWQFFAIGGSIYLLLSLPLGRLARVVENRLKSTTFRPGVDVTSAALAILVASIAIGWFCGLLVDGLSVGNAIGDLSNLFFAIVLSVLLIASMTLLLGIVTYIPAEAWRLLRSARTRSRHEAPVTVAR